MAKTAVADIIIPTEFEKYAIERTAALSAFVQSGIVENAPEFDLLAAGGGREVKMPFWKDLTATRQLLADNASLAVNKISADTDIARIQNDAQVSAAPHLFESNAGGGAAGNPAGGGTGSQRSVKNPFRKDTWNLTEQMKLQKSDPTLAARLKAAA